MTRPARPERAPQRQVAAQTVRARSPSPGPDRRAQVARGPGTLAPHPYRRSLLYEGQDGRRSSIAALPPYRSPALTSASLERKNREGYDGYQGERVSLPPLVNIERMADGYGPSKVSPTRRASRQYERTEAPTEADIRDRRAMLMEGRRWILGMLDDTTAMIRELDNATLGSSINNNNYGVGPVH